MFLRLEFQFCGEYMRWMTGSSHLIACVSLCHDSGYTTNGVSVCSIYCPFMYERDKHNWKINEIDFNTCTYDNHIKCVSKSNQQALKRQKNTLIDHNLLGQIFVIITSYCGYKFFPSEWYLSSWKLELWVITVVS
jgi:hypothetical protein